MILDKNKTNKAWEHLYNRLENDGLVRAKPSRKNTYIYLAGIVASAAVIILLFTLQPGTQLHTLYNNDNTLVTTLNDGSVVYLSEKSSLQYPEKFEEHKRNIYMEGSAVFDVAKKENCPFIIDTKLTQIEVIGTVFKVETNNGFELSVKQGEVKVTLKETQQQVNVKAGEIVVYNNRLLETNSRNEENILNPETVMKFKDEKLADIVNVINKNSKTLKINLSHNLYNLVLTVTFTNETPETIAELICAALDLEYKVQNETIFLYKRE